MRRLDRSVFFETVRTDLFGGNLTHDQTDGLAGLLDYWESHHADRDARWLAYVLATVHHEVDATVQPIKEYGSDEYFFRMYDIEGDRPHIARKLGNLFKGDGVRFHGRGFVQLTGRANYADWEARLGTDLTSSRARADKVLAHVYATQVLFEGMILGTFTGHKLSDYFENVREDWEGARQIVNGSDQKALIAGYGRRFFRAITAASA